MPGNPHPWRMMAALFGGVLLCSFAIEQILSPAGDAVVQAVDARQVNIVGVIVSRSEPARFVVIDGARWYVLADQARARVFAGQKVRIVGVVHESTGLLDIRSILLAEIPRV